MSALSRPPNPSLSARIDLELRRLCIPGQLRGAAYLAYMLSRTVPDQSQLRLITKNLYCDTKNRFGTTLPCVERNARTAIHIGWNRGGGSALEEMACCALLRCPTVSEFLDIVSSYIRRTS